MTKSKTDEQAHVKHMNAILQGRILKLRGEVEDLRLQVRELEKFLEVIREAEARAIEMWRVAHVGREHIWPGRAKLILWLLEQLKSTEK